MSDTLPESMILGAMEKIAQSKPRRTRLVYDKARRTIIEIPIDPLVVPPLLIYEEDADFTCGGKL